ncbi:RagB/SusD family nutrient uptake outer membrane protein [Chitinophaga sp. XS-30]|uniref:RagB/SusD family nutrient uptake outer membrane protein n=1 Tax=Chitinophaga sp. XS-30 TaxID=2604421 RepID=UPI0011DDD43E|nr:RagB/SusD family nutrient uptake outer membrane protein [Chitinophaga sp. XS-30]QEH40646.1 RagB/SusD family nutrient uptake outer membrane protein [Chitinophaga sp. XS-30]
MKSTNLIHHKKARTGILLCMALLMYTGCKSELDLVSEDSITDGIFWKTPNDFKLGANQLYNGLDRFGFEDTESDIAFNDPNSVSNGTYQPTETSGQWTGSYNNIRSANNVIEKGAGTTDPLIKRYVAEARFFRAWYYYKLMRVFGGVPLITKVLNTGDAELFTPRSTRTETVDFILKDLEDASADLQLQGELAGGDIGRITRGAALSLAARVALFEGTWQKFHGEGDANKYLDAAITAATTVMTSGQYGLYTGSAGQSYRYLFLEPGDDSRECILDRRYARNILGHDMPYAYDQSGYNPTRKLVDMYLDDTGLPITHPASVFHGYATFSSEFADRDPRMTMTMIIPGTLTNRVFNPVTKVENWPDKPQRNFNTGYILYKYMSEDATANNSGRMGDASLFEFDRHLIRYAEVLLIYAEAKFERNGAITDADLNMSVNLLRDRVDMPHLTNAFVTTNGLDMREEIRRERTIELALEGFRYDDLRRWKTAETVLPQDVKGIKIKGTDWETRAPYSDPVYQNRTDANGFLIAESNRIFDPAKHYWQPLPTKEVAFYLASGYSLPQNPEW